MHSVQLLTFDTVVAKLNLPPAEVERLVATGQLPEIRIRGHRRFDERDLTKFVDAYKRVQKGRNNEAW